MIPTQFEFVEGDVIKFIHVVEKFTGPNEELMYRVMILYDTLDRGRVLTSTTCTHDDMLEMLKTRVDM